MLDQALDAFTSYSRDDAEVVRPLVDRLLFYDLGVFIDLDGNISGVPWEITVGEAVGRCKIVLGCMSPAALISKDVEKECLSEEGKLLLLQVRRFDWEESVRAHALPSWRLHRRRHVLPLIEFNGDDRREDFLRAVKQIGERIDCPSLGSLVRGYARCNPRFLRKWLEREPTERKLSQSVDGSVRAICDMLAPIECEQVRLDTLANLAMSELAARPPRDVFEGIRVLETVVESLVSDRLKTTSTRSRPSAQRFPSSKPQTPRVGLFPEMKEIPRGQFYMGARDDERERLPYSLPRHLVVIAKPFVASIYPVTRRQWKEYLRATRQSDEFADGEGDHPAVNVSWRMAQAYCAWLSGHRGTRYRLLSESEWEYCCRAGEATAYSFGNQILPAFANFNPTPQDQGAKDYAGTTTPVTRYPANAFGLYDMHGNAWEWVEDVWRPSYDSDSDAGSSTALAEKSELRVIRGGSWLDGADALRSAARSRASIDTVRSNIGFRVAHDLRS